MNSANNVIAFPRANNVIAFPRANKNVQKAMSIEEINHNVEQMKLYHIQETVASIIPIVFTQMEIAGFSLEEMDERESLISGAFIVETLKAHMCRYYGIYHPFQKIIDGVFQPEGDYDNMVLRIVDELNLRLKSEEE